MSSLLATAKERPVNQIDLVPTLALLLGLPIPFNNLGSPIDEAFAGRKGNAWENLASVARMTAAGIKRYQAAYYVARGIEESTGDGSTYSLWAVAEQAPCREWEARHVEKWICSFLSIP